MDNTELAKLIIKQVETEPRSFDMSRWSNHCGTVACLAGHTMLMSGYTVSGMHVPFFIRPDGSMVMNSGQEAQRLLGMTHEERYQPGRRTFSYRGEPGDIFHVSDPDEALAEFRRLADAS